MSLTLTFTGNNSILQSEFVPTLTLDSNYECGLIYFSTFNSIHNINANNNVFVYGEKNTIMIPHGSYDLYDLNDYIKANAKNCHINIYPNKNTLQCCIYCDQKINFSVKNSIGSLLGFSKTVLESNKLHVSNTPVSIIPVSVIRIECDLVHGSFTNGLPTHIISEFPLSVPPGHQLIEVPKNIIYFPIRKRNISEITVKVLDSEGELINFNKENIQLCLHIRKSTC